MRFFACRKDYWIAVVLIIFVSSACNQVHNDPTSTNPLTITKTVEKASPTATVKPSPFPSQTITALAPTKEGTPTATLQFVQADKDIPMCEDGEIPISSQAGFGFEGTIIYQNEHLTGLFSIGGIPLKEKILSGSEQKNNLIGFSPDGAWFAYAPMLSDNQKSKNTVFPLILRSFSGVTTEKRIDFRSVISGYDEPMVVKEYFGDWLNDSSILIHVILNPEDSEAMIWQVKLLNPFDLKWNEELTQQIQYPNGQHAIGFSNDLTRVLYTNSHKEAIVLLDYEKKSEKIIDTNERLVQPGIVSGPFYKWAPNSSKVIYGPVLSYDPNQHLEIISRDGDGAKSITPPVGQNNFIIYLTRSLIALFERAENEGIAKSLRSTDGRSMFRPDIG